MTTQEPETISSLIGDAPPVKALAKLYPLDESDRMELLHIADPHAMGQKPKEMYRGSFGPLPMRTNYDKLLYGTGISYCLGMTAGGVYGAYRGLKIAQGNSYKLKMNSVLNTVTRYGPWAANSLGILTMGWALFDNLFNRYRDSDYINHVSAAFVTGVIYKSTAGLRPALIAGGLMAGAVSAYGALEQFGKRPALAMPTLSTNQAGMA
ncbi:mitochondrial import inner membrane translocase, subunit timm23 [Blyttiomyces sp. JEL0837]|nr:mitochondrial import inner membrane translocase, subunit timm23 [Blyttiomyces sp. JEL0837]